MDIGSLRHRVKILRYQEAGDDQGGAEERYSEHETWAKVEEVSGTKNFRDGLVVTGRPYIITMLVGEDIDEKSQLEYNGKKIYIKSIAERDDFYIEVIGTAHD